MNDAALIQLVQGGDTSAYRELSDRYLERILNFAFRMLNDAAEAEDVAQETFLRLWKHSGEYKPKQKPSTWLFTITKNLCIDRLRKRKPQLVEEDVGSDSARPSTMLERKRISLAVQQAISQLPERQRVALALSHFEGMSNPEIADVLSVGVEAVESLLSRARRRLREQLESLHEQQIHDSPNEGFGR